MFFHWNVNARSSDFALGNKANISLLLFLSVTQKQPSLISGMQLANQNTVGMVIFDDIMSV